MESYRLLTTSRELSIGDDTFGLAPDVDEHLVGIDADHGPVNDVPVR
jgi:hypothetical protein